LRYARIEAFGVPLCIFVDSYHKEKMAMSDNEMRAAVFSKGDLIEQALPEMERRARDVLSAAECRAIDEAHLTGCGDSHHASLATEMAFQRWAGVRTKALTAMQYARYEAPALARAGGSRVAVFSTSVSGEVSRTIETVALARKAGARTIACTGTPASRVAQAAERVMNIAVPPGPGGPGVRGYTMSLLGLYLLAIHIGESKGTLSAAEAQTKRDALRATAALARATAEAADAPAAELAAQTKDARVYVFFGHGPNYATALFSAAKIMEASGDHAQGQDTEEWAHLQYFVRERTTPTFIIAPPGAGYDRAAELLPIINRIGRPAAAIVAADDRVIAPQAGRVLPVPGVIDEIISPLVYCTAGELFAAHLAAAQGLPYFRGRVGPWDPATGGNAIRTSPIKGTL